MLPNLSTEKVKVLGIGGSIRKGSYNRALLRAARELAPKDMEISIFDNETLTMIPTFNEDVRRQGDPETVEILKREISGADALLFAVPEYNYSMSGVLKNAIDWASRPPSESHLDGKPVAIMGSSVGISGTIRAQMHFRQVCVFTNMLPLNKPQVFVTHSAEKFDPDGRLTDEDTREHVRKLTEALLEWTRKLHYGNIMMEIGNKTLLHKDG
ncbi:MAG: NADPH-dependent FMN reductase [Anaerolineales bacterium]|nr:NAD(P)H-dependent oxidoreductase [Anaerolineae bacterium]PWB76856.1 MAG: NADPH-dependent FMN reductase [Anaerolineales bacterium]